MNFITKQTKQYEAYTDRYLAFKVELRKVMPYNKPVAIVCSIKCNGNAVAEFGNALAQFSKILKEACTPMIHNLNQPLNELYDHQERKEL